MAFLLAPLTVILIRKSSGVISRVFVSALIILFMAGFIFSYSRAAWVSLIAALALSLILWLRMPVRLLTVTAAGFIVAIGSLGRMDMAEDGQHDRGFVG